MNSIFDGKKRAIGHTTIYSVDFSTPKDFQVWAAIERRSKKWLKFVLGMLLVGLAWAWVNALSPATYTLEDMRDYAVMEINRMK